jgi:hypothetical protein
MPTWCANRPTTGLVAERPNGERCTGLRSRGNRGVVPPDPGPAVGTERTPRAHSRPQSPTPTSAPAPAVPQSRPGLRRGLARRRSPPTPTSAPAPAVPQHRPGLRRGLTRRRSRCSILTAGQGFPSHHKPHAEQARARTRTHPAARTARRTPGRQSGLSAHPALTPPAVPTSPKGFGTPQPTGAQ